MSSPGLVKQHKVPGALKGQLLLTLSWCISHCLSMEKWENGRGAVEQHRGGQRQLLAQIMTKTGKAKSHHQFWEKFNAREAVKCSECYPSDLRRFSIILISTLFFLLQFSAARSRNQPQQIISISLKLTWKHGLSFLPSGTQTS